MMEQPNDPSRPTSGDPLGGAEPPPFTGAPAPAPAPPPPPPPPAAPLAPPGPPAAFQAPTPSAFSGLTLAGWGPRVGAALVDGLVGLVIYIVPVIIFSAAGKPIIGVLIGALLIALAYYPLTMARPGERNGQTLGKQALNIRVVRDVGQPFDFGSALMREFVVKYILFGVIGGFFLAIPPLLNVLWPLWDDENQALHDKIVNTHVVQA